MIEYETIQMPDITYIEKRKDFEKKFLEGKITKNQLAEKVGEIEEEYKKEWRLCLHIVGTCLENYQGSR